MASLKVLVDWDNNGDFTGAYDDITADVQDISWSLGMKAAYQLVADESDVMLVLKNLDGKYLPENTTSPLYGNIRPNRRLAIKWNDGTTDYDLWSGWIEFPSIDLIPGPNAVDEVTVIGTGAKRKLDQITVDLDFYSDVTGDVIIGDVIERAGLFPALDKVWLLGESGFSELGQTTVLVDITDFSDLDVGVLTIEHYGNLENQKPGAIIEEITQAERGRFFYGRDGQAVWWNRHHLLGTLTDTAHVISNTGDYEPRGVDYAYGRLIANDIKVSMSPRSSQASEVLWSLDTPITLAAGQVVTLRAQLRKSSGQFAGSSNLVATPEFYTGTALVTVQSLGGIAEITIHNTGTTQAVLTSLTLTGVPTTQQHNLSITVADSASISANGSWPLDIDLGPAAAFDDLEEIGQFELDRRKDAAGDIRSVMWNRTFDGVDNRHLLDWTMGARLRLQIDEAYHDRDYFIIGEKHRIDQARRHETTFYLEPATVDSAWLLGESGLSELGQTTILAI